MNPNMTDTLHVRVSDLRYPVTEEVIRSVFGPIAQPIAVHMLHSAPKGTAIAIVRFPDNRSAEMCRQQRDNRCIYSECNRMEIAFTRWESFVPSAVLASPPPVVTGPYDNQFIGQDGYAGFEGRGRGRGRGRGASFGGAPYGGMPAPFDMSGAPQVGAPAPFVGMPMPVIGARGGFASRGGGVAAGRGAIHIPLPGMMPGMFPMHQMSMMQMPFVGQPPLAQQQQQQRVPNAFLSVAMLDKDIPLQPLFSLCEVWGQVVYIRRNFNKPNILTVKYVNPSEAQLAALCLKKTPFFGSTISGRNFEKFVEKSADPNEEGDPNDATVLAYNFTNSRHRLNTSRAKWPPSESLRIWNLHGPVTGEEIHNYYDSIGCQPTEVVGQEDGSFVAHFADLATSVKALVLSHEKVCGDERSCVLFVKSEGTRPPQEASNGAEATTSAPPQED